MPASNTDEEQPSAKAKAARDITDPTMKALPLLAPTIFFSDPLTLFFSSTIQHRAYDHGCEAAA